MIIPLVVNHIEYNQGEMVYFQVSCARPCKIGDLHPAKQPLIFLDPFGTKVEIGYLGHYSSKINRLVPEIIAIDYLRHAVPGAFAGESFLPFHIQVPEWDLSTDSMQELVEKAWRVLVLKETAART